MECVQTGVCFGGSAYRTCEWIGLGVLHDEGLKDVSQPRGLNSLGGMAVLFTKRRKPGEKDDQRTVFTFHGP